MLLCPSRAPSDSGAALFVGGKNPSSSDTLGFLKASTLLASPQAVILSELKLSRVKLALVIAQENPQAGKKEGKALE